MNGSNQSVALSQLQLLTQVLCEYTHWLKCNLLIASKGHDAVAVIYTKCESAIITDRKGKLCFQRRLSIILSTGGSVFGGVCIGGGGSVSVGSASSGVGLHPGGVCIWGSAQPPHTDIQWRPLHRAVRILLECFLVSSGFRCRVVFQLCDINQHNST